MQFFQGLSHRKILDAVLVTHSLDVRHQIINLDCIFMECEITYDVVVTCVSLSLQITFCEQKTRQENSTLFSKNKLLWDWDWKIITWFEEKYFEWRTHWQRCKHCYFKMKPSKMFRKQLYNY